jgi:hypothetical protein
MIFWAHYGSQFRAGMSSFLLHPTLLVGLLQSCSRLAPPRGRLFTEDQRIAYMLAMGIVELIGGTSRRDRAFPSRVSRGRAGSRASSCAEAAAHHCCRAIEALHAQRLTWVSTVTSAAPPPVSQPKRSHIAQNAHYFRIPNRRPASGISGRT